MIEDDVNAVDALKRTLEKAGYDTVYGDGRPLWAAALVVVSRGGKQRTEQEL